MSDTVKPYTTLDELNEAQRVILCCQEGDDDLVCPNCEALLDRIVATARLALRGSGGTPDAPVFRSGEEVFDHYVPGYAARRASVAACECKCHEPRECIQCQHVHDAAEEKGRTPRSGQRPKEDATR